MGLEIHDRKVDEKKKKNGMEIERRWNGKKNDKINQVEAKIHGME